MSNDRKDVFSILDRGENAKPFWLKIGAAWPNRDGSWNVVLDALPVDGRMHIRDAEAREPEGSSSRQAPRR